MKQLMLTLLTAGALFLTFDSAAQDGKVKTKEEKMKEKSDSKKEKSEGDEWKKKQGDNKLKREGDETKMKQGDKEQNMEGDEQKMKIEMSTSNKAMADMPYVADYSSHFVIGNTEHSKKILELWKDFDDNNLQRHADYFADTVMMTGADGNVSKGKEATLSMVTAYRKSLTNVKSTLDAWIPLKSVDRNADWVGVWGTETTTDSQGKTTTVALHEVWSFNKDGKISYMRQYMGQMPKQ